MSDSDAILMSSLNYYTREKYYNYVYNLAEDNLKTFVNDPTLQFFRAISLLLQGKHVEATRQFENVQDTPEFAAASVAAMIHIHKLAKTVDKEAVQDLENRYKDERKTANDKSNFENAIFHFHVEKYDKAKELIDKAVKSSGQNVDYLCLKGFVEMMLGKDNKLSLQTFEDAHQLLGQQKYPDIFLGKAKFNELRQNFNLALESVSHGIVSTPNYLPLHVERMKMQLMLKDWEQCVETAQRCQVIDAKCIPALQYMAINAVCHDGQYNEGLSLLGELMQKMDKDEPENAYLYLDIGQQFSRVCGKNNGILLQTKMFVDKAASIAKTDPNVLSELAYQYRLIGQTKQAQKLYKQIIQSESASSTALLGVVHCQLLEGELSEAESQIELIKAVHQQNITKSTEMKYLEILIEKRKDAAAKDTKSKLIKLIKQHIEEFKKVTYGPLFFVNFNPDFVLEVVNELFGYVPIEPAKNVNMSDPTLKDITTILSEVIEAVPGLVEAIYLIGKAKYLSGETDSAQSFLQQCLNKDQTFSEAHLLLAQIYLQKDQFKLASQSLEVGLSFNFEVRDHPIYHLIKARIMKKSNNVQGSIPLLQNAMNLPKFKKTDSSVTVGGSSKKQSRLEMTEADRVAVYIELIDSYKAMDKPVEATQLMHEALTEFQGTKEEQHLMLMNADIALARGDVEKSLNLLKTVTPDQAHYLEARQKMADIYLHHKKDKRQFALCFKDIVEKNPSPQALVLLGDAYMSIQEPDKAIELFEAALKKNPKDHALSSKIGRALVKSHNYLKAVNYYEAALKTGQLNFLRYDLADLLLKLGNFEKCERVLKQGLEGVSSSGSDVQTKSDEVKFQTLLSKLYFETGNWEGAIQLLLQAKENQAKILKRGPNELADNINQYRTTATDICNQLGQFYENHRDFSKSVGFYKEALTFSPNNVKIMLSMAHLYLLMGDLDNCHQICQNVLKIDKDNDQATLMLADLMYQKNQSDAALKHFQQLLERNPNQYHAMARAVELAWRMGDLDRAEKYIERALDNSSRATVDAGFNYCKGLLEWFTGDPNAALQHFNRARRDLEWGERAIYNMIEICLNPDNEIIGGEVFDTGEAVDNTTSADKADAREMGVRTAERFLKELRFKPGLDYKYRLMENFILLATKNKPNIEQAISTFNEMAGGDNGEVTNVGTILGLARGYMMLKQTPKAKTQLKRVVGHAWNFEEADYLEQCWLLLADTYINQSKYDVATEILKTCLQYNASCLKALEFLGFIREKEQKWTEAAANYEHAWNLSKQRNPTIGYKLAFNYLKSKKFVDAIDTCHRVLQAHPNYPKIKRDVLDKARASLRM